MERDVIFSNSSGRKLHGVLAIPDAKTFPVVIICHGYASSVRSKTRIALSRRLLLQGIASFGFDFTGCGESEGELKQLTLSQGLDDLTAAYFYVKHLKSVDKNRIGVLGSSFSGSVAVLFAAENRVKALALKSPVSDYGSISRVPLDSEEKRKQFSDDAEKYAIYSSAEKIKAPTIIVHGSSDDVVPVEQSKKLFSHLKCEKKLEIIKGADHSYSDDRHFSRMVASVSEWFHQHLSKTTNH